MNVKQIFDLAIEMGINADLRGKEAVEKMLKRKKEQYKKLNEEQKNEFDEEAISNPYLDSRIHFDSGKPVKKILTGIDMEGDEVLLADKLKDIDLILAHHPRGKALANLADVMHLQAEVYAQYGVPINIAEAVQKERIEEVARGVNPINHYRPINVAEILGISYVNVHTPADNLVANFLRKKIEEAKPEYVSEILKLLKEVPEYKEAIKQGAGPTLFAGNPDNRCGKVAITEITGGTEPSKKIYEKIAQAGVGTIVCMHLSEEHKKEAEAAHINAIIAGHISSDSLGMNFFLDELEKNGIEIVPCSGLIRVKRFKK
ncbi:NGG1p interacting factor NIF3 [Candidatus Falkowbacteria bacterium RIFOXYB2_FULL_38_15]|uniref:NGG1p interacting factor NIF3 n=1 Tax=Candidatus Falkowbacteria bacterium RIFOXYA2_FULL_38_12 TaxID=1797993 RepID=A0A1F5S4Y9_9BACT|nr:MAG: NGG1p interacting factor NIF3 [Candidatus Falkowbacteria bacterium RIFOXYA2_FULL_38_12]OGF32825.1 MAG: NGG1p interacting factor NIF3 [Candidatus Falkowbacteria bacterium RIFOXYB2_FULL_38_15]OGF42271.1 MAG: NGG1p interacting factor NIF3 [Candidatus Falkowbacteria bacterium RIFOXYD2_FULL_39_16]